jgi:hypothetical protein
MIEDNLAKAGSATKNCLALLQKSMLALGFFYFVKQHHGNAITLSRKALKVAPLVWNGPSLPAAEWHRGRGDASSALLFLFFKKAKIVAARQRMAQRKSGAPSSAPNSFHVTAIISLVAAIASRLRHPLSDSPPLKRLLAPCCASCAGRTAPDWRRRRPSRAGRAWRSGTPVRGARRSGSVRDRR